jgi:hypothetical protein
MRSDSGMQISIKLAATDSIESLVVNLIKK